MNEKPKRIDPTPATKQKLYGFSGLRCYSPDCDNILIGKDGKTKLGKIAHMEAALVGGARYNSNMSNEDRRHFNNLILLCDECHCIIDNLENEKDYPLELLRKWKMEQEDKIKYLKLKKNFLKIAIEYLSDLDFPEQEILSKKGKKIPFDINKKIAYNSIKNNKILIEDYKIYYHIINNLYNELDDNAPFKKKNLLRNINNMYLKIKGKYAGDSRDEIEAIRKNADNIIDDMREEIFKSSKIRIEENIIFEIDLIIVDSFIKCKILEEPPKNDN